jgi:hypothetical protein
MRCAKLLAGLVSLVAALSLLVQPMSATLAAQTETGNPTIAFITRDWEARTLTISLSDPEGTNLIPFITNAPNDGLFNPIWSPDGTQLAFSANVNGSSRYNVYVINGDGSNLHRLNIAGDVASYFGTSWGLIPEEFVPPSAPISLADA